MKRSDYKYESPLRGGVVYAYFVVRFFPFFFSRLFVLNTDAIPRDARRVFNHVVLASARAITLTSREGQDRRRERHSRGRTYRARRLARVRSIGARKFT